MKNSLASLVLVVISFAMASPVFAVDWRFPLGLSYISGMQDISNLFKYNYEADNPGSTVSIVDIPVGISFSPYVQLHSGLAFGGTIGPMMLLSTYSNSGPLFFNLPIGADVRYFVFPWLPISPYIRAGVKYNVTAGDYVDSSLPGVLVGVGAEFLRNRHVGFGIEGDYDSSEIKFEDHATPPYSLTNIKPSKFMVSMFAVF